MECERKYVPKKKQYGKFEVEIKLSSSMYQENLFKKWKFYLKKQFFKYHPNLMAILPFVKILTD